MWLYAICDKDANIVQIGDNIHEFVRYLRKLTGKTIYFHNLKFDGEFIVSYLLSTGWTHYKDLKDTEQGFSVLMGEMGEFYGLDIKFSKKHTVHIHDSLKLLPFKVEKIAKDFGLPILKEKIDYEKYERTPEAERYISHDVQIIAMALAQIKEEGMTKMTTASCAYNAYASMRTSEYMSYQFPELSDDFLTEWREAYRGGRSQVNPIYKGQILHKVHRYDINSMYPAVMMNEKLPYGYPIEITKRDTTSFELYCVKIWFELKKGHLPSLLKKAGLYAGEDSYYIDTDGIETIWISSVDYKLLEKHYDILYVEFIKMYGFACSNYMFSDYVTKWYNKKSQDSGAQKVVDKLMLNCLYGKFGSKHKGCRKLPYLNEEGVVKYTRTDEEELKHYYLPLAIAITSYAHKYIDDAIEATGYENFVYCDTDSVHTRGSLPHHFIDQEKLGKFKYEACEEQCKYVRQKTYITLEEGKIIITCAGMPDAVKKDVIKQYGMNIFNEFQEGFVATGKLVPKHVRGGVILNVTTFKIT